METSHSKDTDYSMDLGYSVYAKKTCGGEYEVSFTPQVIDPTGREPEPACVIAVTAGADGALSPTVTRLGHPLVGREELDRRAEDFKRQAVEAIRHLAAD